MTPFRQTTHSEPMEDAHAEHSWRDWIELHGPKLLLCARQWTRSRADAEDVVQDAFVRFWRRQRHLGGEPLALLLTSIRRAALDRARRETRRTAREEFAEISGAGETPLFEPLADVDDRRRAIEVALHRLAAEQREVLVLKIWGGLTFAAIAAQLDLPANTVASRYRYALNALRRELTGADCHG